LDADIFGDRPSKKIRYKKPEKRPKQTFTAPKHLKKVSTATAGKINLFDNKIVVGNIVKHARFGNGEVLSLEGTGSNTKASIKFKEGTKKLLLQFAKLEVVG
jgi:DNA helicase-2/ATP-dependent DNA helicase PcrA